MKPDYKNWIPKGMLVSLIAGTVLSFTLLLVFGVFGVCVSGKLRVVLGVVFGIAFVVCAKYTQWCVYAYRVFSYDGERKLSKQIIDGTAEHITLPEGGVGLDIGCGSGALTIACAKDVYKRQDADRKPYECWLPELKKVGMKDDQVRY